MVVTIKPTYSKCSGNVVIREVVFWHFIVLSRSSNIVMVLREARECAKRTNAIMRKRWVSLQNNIYTVSFPENKNAHNIFCFISLSYTLLYSETAVKFLALIDGTPLVVTSVEWLPSIGTRFRCVQFYGIIVIWILIKSLIFTSLEDS